MSFALTLTLTLTLTNLHAHVELVTKAWKLDERAPVATVEARKVGEDLLWRSWSVCSGEPPALEWIEPRVDEAARARDGAERELQCTA